MSSPFYQNFVWKN